jgi:hypothetical protein
MIALIDLYRKELLKVNGFAPSTVETYTLSIKAFCRFAKNEIKTDPVNVNKRQRGQVFILDRSICFSN